MPVEQYNLFGKKVSQTYHNLVQSGSDGKFYDGDGNEITINATIPDIYVLTSSFNNYTSSINSYTQSINDKTGSFTTTSSFNSYTSSINTYTQSLNNKTGSFATTGSNRFIGNQTITGSLTISSSNALNISGSIFVSSGSFPFQTSRYIVGWDSQSNQLVTYLTTSIAGGGGGGTPGGSTNQFQYNDNNTFGGATSLNYNPTTTYTSLTGSVLIPTGAALTHTFNSSSLTEFRSDQFSYITKIIIPTSRTGSIFDLTSLGYIKSNYNSMYFEYSLITTGSNNLIKRGEIKCVYDSNSYDFVDQYMEISGSVVRDMTFNISQTSTNIFLNYTASAGLRSLSNTYLLKGIIKLL
jgi:hypothetical protein